MIFLFSLSAIFLLSFYLLFVFYLAVMNIKGVNDSTPLTGVTRIAGLSVLYPGLFLDALVNLVVLTVVFVELPREYLVTSRLSRHIKDTDGWRKKLSVFICSKLLDKFDPRGCHCK